MHQRGYIQTLNLIMHQKQHQIVKSIKNILYKNTNANSSASIIGLSPNQSYVGLKMPKINNTLMDIDRGSVENATFDKLTLDNSLNINQRSVGPLGMSRSPLNSFQDWYASPITHRPKIMMTLMKENMKIKKQKNLMKNIIKNQIMKDQKMKELKKHMQEKEKKRKEILRQNYHGRPTSLNLTLHIGFDSCIQFHLIIFLMLLMLIFDRSSNDAQREGR